MKTTHLKTIKLAEIEKFDENTDYTEKVLNQIDDDISEKDLTIAIKEYIVQVLLNNKEEIYRKKDCTTDSNLNYLKAIINKAKETFINEYRKRIENCPRIIYELDVSVLQRIGMYITQARTITKGHEDFTVIIEYIVGMNIKNIYVEKSKPIKYVQYIEINEVPYYEDRRKRKLQSNR